MRILTSNNGADYAPVKENIGIGFFFIFIFVLKFFDFSFDHVQFGMGLGLNQICEEGIILFSYGLERFSN